MEKDHALAQSCNPVQLVLSITGETISRISTNNLGFGFWLVYDWESWCDRIGGYHNGKLLLVLKHEPRSLALNQVSINKPDTQNESNNFPRKSLLYEIEL